MNRFKRFALGLVGAGGILGFQYYNKGQSHDEMKADLIKMCDKEKPCVAAVNKHFDSCFDGAYHMPTKRKSATFDQGVFLNCFNERSGKVFFSLAGTEPSEAEAH